MFDESGAEARGVVGPYQVGETVILKCVSDGHADPPPALSWWRDARLIDSTFESAQYGQNVVVQNTLTLTEVTRADLGAQLTCEAKNNNVSMPARTRVTLDLKCE